MLYGLNMAKLNLISLKYGDFGSIFPNSIHNPHFFFFCCQVENNCQKERKNLNVGPDLKTSETCIMASTEDAP